MNSNAAKTAAVKDIFHAIAERDAADALEAAAKAKGPKRTWHVLGTSRGLKRLYTYNQARRLASRYNRRFTTDRAYAAR